MRLWNKFKYHVIGYSKLEMAENEILRLQDRINQYEEALEEIRFRCTTIEEAEFYAIKVLEG